ncbi:MAG TPA: 3'-5' exonuclease [Anaerolineae bacterium]|nr:3'-5' exonuclease [Anaerolineae bacterium]
MIPSSRNDAIRTAREILQSKPIYLDTETTGIGPMDSIIEIAIIDYDGSVLLDSLVKPVGQISRDAFQVHGISNEMVKDAPSWLSVWEKAKTILANRTVAIYNAEFDVRMMRQTHTVNWISWESPPGTQYVCLMKLYAQYYGVRNPKYGSFKWHSLDTAGRQCGINLPNTHRAKDDTLLARALLIYMAQADN